MKSISIFFAVTPQDMTLLEGCGEQLGGIPSISGKSTMRPSQAADQAAAVAASKAVGNVIAGIFASRKKSWIAIQVC